MKTMITPGLQVQTINGERDTDAQGVERITPAGTWGHISAHNHQDHWDIAFPNGGWIVLTEAELVDTTQYRLRKPETLEQCALALQYGEDQLELTYLDDKLIPYTEKVAGNPKLILETLKEAQSLKEDAEDMLEVIRLAHMRWDRLDQEDNPFLGDALCRIAEKQFSWEKLQITGLTPAT